MRPLLLLLAWMAFPGLASGALSKSEWVAKIERLTADKSCKSDSDCDAAALGHRSCGGPERYVIYSKSKTNRERLRIAIRNFDALDKKSKSGMGGICVFEEAPVVACVSGSCQRKTASSP